MSFFSLDSKFMQAMGRVSDLLILNFLFLLTSLPIFTIGAASTALYSIVFRMGTERAFRCYFRAFRDNFKQGTVLFLLLFLPILLLVIALFFYASLSGILHLLTYLCAALLVLLVLIYSYAFPLISQFRNTLKGTVKNALLLSIGNLPRSIVAAVLYLLPLALLYFHTYFFIQLGIIWILLYFSTAAYINSQIFRKIFAQYQTSQEDETQ